MGKVISVNEVYIPNAETETQYIDTCIAIPTGAIIVRPNLQLELLAGDMGQLSNGVIVEGYQVTLAQSTLQSLRALR